MTSGTNNRKFSIYEVGLGLEIDRVCAKAVPSIVPMVVRMLEFGGDSAMVCTKTYWVRQVC